VRLEIRNKSVRSLSKKREEGITDGRNPPCAHKLSPKLKEYKEKLNHPRVEGEGFLNIVST
jgi:hypothetical protein